MIDKKLFPPKPFQIMSYTEDNFVRVGDSHLRYFQKTIKLKRDAQVLEIGSGNGRIARALSTYLDQGSYLGMEIMHPFVDWCNKAYSDYPNFNFQHIDVYNQHYNPESTVLAKNFRFPHEDNSYDFIFMTSVFTHMLKDDVQNYLKEVQRMLKPDGVCLITYFIIDDLALEAIAAGKSTRKFFRLDDVSYTDNPQVPETAIAYKEEYLLNLYTKYDLIIDQDSPALGRWRNPKEVKAPGHNQDRIVARKIH